VAGMATSIAALGSTRQEQRGRHVEEQSTIPRPNHSPRAPHAGSERGVDLRRRGHTTQLSPSIGPRSTGLPRRLTRRRGARLLAEQRSFVQNYQDGDGEEMGVVRALTTRSCQLHNH
jgi:hypothetical protein